MHNTHGMSLKHYSIFKHNIRWEGGREGGRERGREEGKEGERERGKEGGREEGREREREGEHCLIRFNTILTDYTTCTSYGINSNICVIC